MNLQFCFVSDEIARERRPLTMSEINELRTLAHTIEGIIEVMTVYTQDAQDNSGDERRGMACCAAVFKALAWLMEPVNRYLFEYAGEAAAPDPIREGPEISKLTEF